MYVCARVCMCVYMLVYVYACVYARLLVFLRVRVHACVHVCIYTHACVYICVWVSTYVLVHGCVLARAQNVRVSTSVFLCLHLCVSLTVRAKHETMRIFITNGCDAEHFLTNACVFAWVLCVYVCTCVYVTCDMCDV